MDYFQKNHGFCPRLGAFANPTNRKLPKFYDDLWSENWYEPRWINHPFRFFHGVVQKPKQSGAKAIFIVPNWPKQSWFQDIMDVSIDTVELPHKALKLYCEDNSKPWPHRSWSTLACLVDGNLGDHWQESRKMRTEEMISNSSTIDEIDLDGVDRERNPDTSSRKEGRTNITLQESAFIRSKSPPSYKNQVKNVKISIKNDDKSPRISHELTRMHLNSADHLFKTFEDPFHWLRPMKIELK